MILEITLISRAGAGFVYVELYTLKNSQCDSVAKSPGVALNVKTKPMSVEALSPLCL